MLQYTAKDVFQLQTELVDSKVDMAASKTIDRVIDRIDTLKSEMIERFDNVKSEIHDINVRLAAVEAKLSLRIEMQRELKNRIIEYAFKVAWLLITCIVSVSVSFMFLYLHTH